VDELVKQVLCLCDLSKARVKREQVLMRIDWMSRRAWRKTLINYDQNLNQFKVDKS
jgi:sulfur relay (sulfurtransferase) DsrF/TusC family protein